ncbi:MAG: hypothetical protein MI807_14595 [Verrucomicrobiales bacterium]|nr:hypothetical protein [Verrucomicrobiales bacterium]
MPGEISAFKDCARLRNLLIDLPHWQSQMERGGQEHDIFEPDFDDLIYKLTRKNEFGLFPHYDPETRSIGSRPALPSEYLRRLELQNELFADDIRLMGLGITDVGAVYTLPPSSPIRGAPRPFSFPPTAGRVRA